jgi:hypothetical protein
MSPFPIDRIPLRDRGELLLSAAGVDAVVQMLNFSRLHRKLTLAAEQADASHPDTDIVCKHCEWRQCTLLTTKGSQLN